MSGGGARDDEPATSLIPPVPASLPTARSRARRGGPALKTIDVLVEVVTPIFGGSVQPREVDKVDVIRPASVRGHLRFWWRALHGHQWGPKELYDRESALWGQAATERKGGRSAVDLRIDVDVQRVSELARRSVEHLSPEEVYALWPARKEQKHQTPEAERRDPGTRFHLRLLVPKDLEDEVRNVVRAWILFGGYGGRTRRGLGSLRVLDNEGEWLPGEATAIATCFGRNIFSPPGRSATDTPWLAGASLYVGKLGGNAEQAWVISLSWLREFRQGSKSGARRPGRDDRPSISNWPEADKIRKLSRLRQTGRWAHTPRHNAVPIWPRAAFGLPIIGRFQDSSRVSKQANGRSPFLRWNELPANHPNYGEEPGQFELGWRALDDRDNRLAMDRLASPLIVKALPLAGGRYAPCALWLNRAYPEGVVGLVQKQGREEKRVIKMGTEAAFDDLRAPDDVQHFAPLRGHTSLREAFLDWLQAAHKTTKVSP